MLGSPISDNCSLTLHLQPTGVELFHGLPGSIAEAPAAGAAGGSGLARFGSFFFFLGGGGGGGGLGLGGQRVRVVQARVLAGLTSALEGHGAHDVRLSQARRHIQAAKGHWDPKS